MAADRDVVIGAQVSYPDLAGFGRRFLDISPADLTAAVIYQIGALDGLARASGTRVRYVKPHGALYNAAIDHQTQAGAVVSAVIAYDATLPILGLPDSALLRIAAERGLRTVTEYFIDRNYTPEGRLVHRSQPHAMITDPQIAAERAARAVEQGVAESLCTHGDSPGAVAMARAVRAELDAAGVSIAPFIQARS
jgi:UPF0271 protein